MKKILLTLMVSTGITMSCIGTKKDNKQPSASQTKKAIEVTKADFSKKIVDLEGTTDQWNFLGNKPAIVDFYATWCGPCKMIAPILENLAAEYEGQIDIYKVDTDAEGEIAAMFGIQSLPSLLFIPMKGQPQLTKGAMSKEELKKIIDQVLLNK